MAKEHVVVVGGGLAGIAASVSLLQRSRDDLQVTLIEQRSFLGGRAYSYQKPGAPPLDNGLHVTLGCYNYYRDLLNTIGGQSGVHFQPKLRIPYRGFYKGKRISTELATGALPSPLNLLSGLVRMRDFGLTEAVDSVRMGPSLLGRKRLRKNDCTVAEWLKKSGQHDRICEWLWTPITLAALNRDPEHASASILAEVLYRAFLTGRRSASIGLFQRHLNHVHGERARDYIDHHGGQLILGQTAKQWIIENGCAKGVLLGNGDAIVGDKVICAIPHHSFTRLLDDDAMRLWPDTQQFSDLGGSPIVNVYLQYDKKPLDIDFACLLGTESQWVFDVSHLNGGENMISVTISDARNLLKTSNPEIADLVHRELKEVFGDSFPNNYRRSWVIKERRATLDHCPKNERIRPGVTTPIKNFFVAGDWTDTGLPCTLEGAAQSGFVAAEKSLT